MSCKVTRISVDKHITKAGEIFPAPQVAWWPSMPLINKRGAPAIAGVGVLYSEEMDVIFHAFTTNNLLESLHSFSRGQSIALVKDPHCRVCWQETSTSVEAELIYKQIDQSINNSKNPARKKQVSLNENLEPAAQAGSC